MCICRYMCQLETDYWEMMDDAPIRKSLLSLDGRDMRD